MQTLNWNSGVEMLVDDWQLLKNKEPFLGCHKNATNSVAKSCQEMIACIEPRADCHDF